MVDNNQTIIEAYIHADYNMEILGQKWRALTNFLALRNHWDDGQTTTYPRNEGSSFRFLGLDSTMLC